MPPDTSGNIDKVPVGAIVVRVAFLTLIAVGAIIFTAFKGRKDAALGGSSAEAFVDSA